MGFNMPQPVGTVHGEPFVEPQPCNRAAPLTEGKVCKGGQNPPNASGVRPPAPGGSGGIVGSNGVGNASSTIPATTTEEALVYNLCVCEQQLKAAIDAAAKAGIGVRLFWHGLRSDLLTGQSHVWNLDLSKQLHYPTEATP